MLSLQLWGPLGYFKQMKHRDKGFVNPLTTALGPLGISQANETERSQRYGIATCFKKPLAGWKINTQIWASPDGRVAETGPC